MEPINQKSIERVVSQRALQMGSSFLCQICVVGFLCGVCLTSLFLVCLTSIGTFQFGGFAISSGFLSYSQGINSSSSVNSTGCRIRPKERLNIDSVSKKEGINDESTSLLYSAWNSLLNESTENNYVQNNLPNAPHLVNCKLKIKLNKHFDHRDGLETFPSWTSWKGLLDMFPSAATNERFGYFRHQSTSRGAHPPWVTGSDEENYPLTRTVQRDMWLHQHPLNCSDPSIKFLVADWERLPGFGIGAQIESMSGLLAIAINRKRVLVTNYYNRADHDGCKGSSHSSWSCYFFTETSQECRDRAFQLMGSEKAWKQGNITVKENYTTKEIWAGRIPRRWNDPWSYLQPTTEINGSLIAYHLKMDIRWWRAQAVRYLMRFQSEYTCDLMNTARHDAFGKEAASMVIRRSYVGEWPRNVKNKQSSDMEEYVWSNHKTWMPQPLLSMHVRMGDKASEMKIVEFEEYMLLARRIRKRFPHLNSIWLSTKMQEVIDKSKGYPQWKFYYTNVKRQVANTTMATYEASLGRKTSTNYPLVNFLMAAEADFFIGALGSSWCFLIDGMRNTGGKVMAGYLSVNKDRFW